ncbi:MAG: acyl-ACP--UDP-N-acetylglucosamine O-acyltransferase [Candidatus Kryptoniota bacterium]
MGVYIDPRAVVNPAARLGEDVSVGPFSIIESDVEVGDGTRIASAVYIANGARIGRNCIIHHGAVVSNAPQDLKYGNEPTVLQIGDNTVVREYCTLHRGTRETGATIVGSNCLLMAYVHIAHDCRVGHHCIFANAVTLAGHVHVGDWATIGGLVAIHQFTHVGSHVMIGGGYRVTKDVPPYVLAGREPLKYEGLNIVGLRRRGFSPEQIENIEKAYHIVYRSGLTMKESIEELERSFNATPEVSAIIDFLKISSRGIIR